MAASHIVQRVRQLVFLQPAVGSSLTAFSCRTVNSIRLNSSNLRNYCSAPKGRLYSDKHEWVEVSGKIGTVGVSQYAQEALGDVVYAQLPDVGLEVCQHDEVGALESVKAASELYSPISGKVVEKNCAVEESPNLINKSCYEEGWLFKVEMSKADTELKELMNEESYAAFLKEEQH
ncbi:glycine cleavage system H protein, mitochondrial [Cimex lectularius]|uniref:Glycine cleavage system H protein n=1 Tax=Cimex lectularius TaxID=79782 RepID=A0A8I6SFT2_CIMLE|nr:glycine cleavage system H protein, mitochondrial [Cimex lectularius]